MNVASQLPEDAVIVEVGSFLGQSAVALAGACRLRGSGRVYCVDPFDGSGDRFSEYYYAQIAAQSTKSLRERFERHVTRAGLNDWIEVNQGTAEVVGKQWTRPIDFLYLDGDQSPEGARRAFDRFLPFLKPDALIGLHNSSDRTYHEGHDGYRRLVVEVVKPPNFIVVACVGSTTFAQRLRIEDAKRRLERTEAPVDEVSWRVGYEDPAFFRRLFKRTTGLAPGAYRKRFRIPEFARINTGVTRS